VRDRACGRNGSPWQVPGTPLLHPGRREQRMALGARCLPLRGAALVLPCPLTVPLCTVGIEHPAARRWLAVRSRLRRLAGRFTAHVCRDTL